MLTKEKTITRKVHIFAIPIASHALEEGGDPFTYEVYPYENHYDENAVRVMEHEVTVTIPAGLNLVSLAIDTLESLKEKEETSYNIRVNALDSRIKDLLRISYDEEATD